jgi:hypothetical protein
MACGFNIISQDILDDTGRTSAENLYKDKCKKPLLSFAEGDRNIHHLVLRDTLIIKRRRSD